MDDRADSSDLAGQLERLLADFAVSCDEGEAPGTSLPEEVANLIDAQLARLLASTSDTSARGKIKMARQVLQACRQASLHGSSENDRNENEASDDHDATGSLVGLLQALSNVERVFGEGGLLPSRLKVVRGELLLALSRMPGVDGESTRGAALEALSGGLSVLWEVNRDVDLAALHDQTGILWAELRDSDGPDNIERAIQCFQAALTVYTPKETAHAWASTQNNLGNAYKLGSAYNHCAGGDRVECFERAIECYRAALTIYTPQRTPHDWARTQVNLGAWFKGGLHAKAG